jgi:hypothetical protein
LPNSHIQVAAERTFDDLPMRGDLRYVRASAGFAGFPRGGCDANLLREFSAAMSERLGKRWHEWGSEQVTSNFVLANTVGAEVLPYPKYSCFAPMILWQEAAFLHFIGTYRFTNGVYAKLAQQTIHQFPRRGNAK